jgi:hypothetical protein
MIKYFLLLFTLIFTPQSENLKNSAVSLEEYVVISAYLDTIKISPEDGKAVKRLVINQSTADAGQSCLPSEIAQFYPRIASERLQPAFADLQDKSKTLHQLSNKFSSKYPYSMPSRKDLDRLFAKDDELFDGWKNFYKQYPDSSGYLSFSRVGFNADKTMAIFFRTMSCGILCASGDYYVLERVDGVWKVKDVFNCWMS